MNIRGTVYLTNIWMTTTTNLVEALTKRHALRKNQQQQNKQKHYKFPNTRNINVLQWSFIGNHQSLAAIVTIYACYHILGVRQSS